MSMILSEEQNMLKDSAKDFCGMNTPITQLRKLRDDADENGYDLEAVSYTHLRAHETGRNLVWPVMR